MVTKIFKKSNSISQKGFGMIEIIIAATIGIVLFLSFEQYLNISFKAAKQDTNQAEAIYRLGAMLEQARSVRDEGWDNIASPAVDGTGKYHFTNDGGVTPDKWATVSGVINDGKYTMWLKNYPVNRDGNKNIDASGADADSNNTIKITASISWLVDGVAKQLDMSEYLTNFK